MQNFGYLTQIMFYITAISVLFCHLVFIASGFRFANDVRPNANLRVTRSSSDGTSPDMLMFTCSVQGKSSNPWDPSNKVAAVVWLKDGHAFDVQTVAEASRVVQMQWRDQQDVDDTRPEYAAVEDQDAPIIYKLVLMNPQPKDNGYYQCLMPNVYGGTISKVVPVNIDSVSHVPSPPRVSVECNETTATIEWHSVQHADMRRHTLFVRSLHDEPFNWRTEFLAYWSPQNQTYHYRMSPGNTYSFRVVVRSIIGESMPTDADETCTTSPSVPDRHPGGVTIGDPDMSPQPNVLSIRWKTIPKEHHNGPGFFYRVFWKQDNVTSQWQFRDIADYRQSKLDVTEQPVFERFRVKVEAHNALGQANVPAYDVTGFSTEGHPSESPGTVSYLMQNATTALVSWPPIRPESLQGHFKGYKVLMWNENEEEWYAKQVSVVPPEKSSIIISSLTPNVHHFVRVLAYNGKHDGPTSEKLDLYVPETKPGPISSVEIVPWGPTSLIVLWRRPKHPNGELTGYQILCEPSNKTTAEAKEAKVVFVSDQYKTFAFVSDLRPETPYEVSVRAQNKVGLGETSVTREFTTHSPASKERPFTWKWLDGSDGKAAISVEWLPTFKNQGGISFQAQFRQANATEWQKSPLTLFYENSIDIKGLEPNTQYELSLVAVDGERSLPSDTVDVVTLDDDFAEGDPRLRYSLQVSPKTLDAKKRFVIEYGPRGTSARRRLLLPKWSYRSPSVSIDDLRVETTYEVTVTAVELKQHDDDDSRYLDR